MKSKLAGLSVLAALVSAPAFAAPIYSVYSDNAGFNAGLGGAGTIIQDFDGYSMGDDLMGADVLGGITLTSNTDVLQAWGAGDVSAFGIGGRDGDGVYYQFNIGGAFNAFAFDIESFNPETSGPGIVEVFFTDGSSIAIDIFPTNATEDDPIFFGIITAGALDFIRWHEGPETDGNCCEETTLDNLIAARVSVVPTPATLPALLLGMSGLYWLRRRNKA